MRAPRLEVEADLGIHRILGRQLVNHRPRYGGARSMGRGGEGGRGAVAGRIQGPESKSLHQGPRLFQTPPSDTSFPWLTKNSDALLRPGSKYVPVPCKFSKTKTT